MHFHSGIIAATSKYSNRSIVIARRLIARVPPLVIHQIKDILSTFRRQMFMWRQVVTCRHVLWRHVTTSWRRRHVMSCHVTTWHVTSC